MRRTQVGELNLTGIEKKIVFEHDVECRSAGQFGVRPARQKNGAESGEAANASADASALAASSDGANARARHRRRSNRLDVLPFASGAGYFALGIHGFFATRIRASRGGIQIDGVAIRQDERIQTHPEFTAALDAAWPLGFKELTPNVGAYRNHNAIVLRKGKRSMKVHGIAGLGSPG